MFKKNALNKKYQLHCEPGTRIMVKAGSLHAAYSGPISGVTDADILDGMIARGSNLVSLKQAKQAAEEVAPPGEEPTPDNQNEQ